ncbi:uncharacterized protein LOC110722509 [Chenopodium quinoa]|uniref:KIB1-4 beta-propeller domain-containing protein n=1 Tax=Chenopodium quinoa TaxID=63459 RepID=A0A803LWG0_CHEQI|nr:uncharacterized protein LOC110722509 [Chenopodium quinoa]
MRDWGNMPKDIVTKIVEHVEFYEDYETLLKICSNWRSAGKEASLRGYANANATESMHTLPWLMLRQKQSSMSHRLYSFSKRMVRLISLPAELNYKKPMLSSRGWLLVLSKTKQVSILNPFSGAIIELPILKLWNTNHIDFRDFDWHRTILNRFILSADPSTSSDFVVFLSVSFSAGTDNLASNLVFWRNNRGAGACSGDGHGWIHVRDPLVPLGPILPDYPYHTQLFLSFYCTDLTFYQGEFYGVNIFGMFVKFETAKGNPHFHVVAVIDGHVPNMLTYDDNETAWFHYLVESSGKLLVIRQVTRQEITTSKRRHIFRFQTIRFEVFELNVMAGELNEVSSLGNRTIFLGLNSSFSVESSRGFKPNCIYYTDDSPRSTPCQTPGRHGGCLYNLTNGKFEDHFYNCRSSYLGKLTPLIWLESPYS